MIIRLDRTAFKRRIWQRAYKRALGNYSRSYDSNNQDEKTFQSHVEKVIFYGIKNYGTWKERIKNRPIELLENQYLLDQTILVGMKYITPRQFMGWFPITKDYDGERFEMKDYYTTMEYIDENGIDKPIREPLEFLWEYMNKDTRMFLINHTGTMSDIRKHKTGMGIMEEFLIDIGVEAYYREDI
ncbi:phage protein [Enterococcus sp. 5H]|nr:phage protein [Enterococcus sp. 5H]